VRDAIVLAACVALAVAPRRAAAQDPTLDRARAVLQSRQAASEAPGLRAELAAYVKANPRSAPGALLLGRAYFVEGRWDKAAEWFERAAELDARSAPAHYFLGAAYGQQAMGASKLKQPFLAKKVQHAFERAVQLDPEYLDARTGLLDFYRMAPGFMGGGMDKARVQAAEIRKRDALRGAYAFASIALAEKRPDVAAKEYELVIAAAPDSVGPYLTLAELRGQQGHWEDGWGLLERYRARRPGDPRLSYFVGRLAASSGQRLDDGEAALQRYLRQPAGPDGPTHAAAHWRLGQIREHRKDVAGARREYQAAIRLDSAMQAPRTALARLPR
jgi:tetratricopeptide (TPR) repeat protein